MEGLENWYELNDSQLSMRWGYRYNWLNAMKVQNRSMYDYLKKHGIESYRAETENLQVKIQDRYLENPKEVIRVLGRGRCDRLFRRRDRLMKWSYYQILKEAANELGIT